MRDWFNKKKGKDNTEETPLLGGGSTSRKSTRKVITIAVASVVALGVLGTAGYFIHNCHDGHKGRMLTYTLFFFFFKKKLLLIHFTFNFKKGYSPTYPPLTETEKLMLELPSNDNIRGYLKTYTSEAHLAGTESDKRQAEWTRNQFQSFGLNSTIETYWPMLNYPISHRFGIVTGPEDLRYEAKLTVDEDETSKNPDNVPLFHGYSKNGTVTGRVVYANYGRVEDFQFLKDSGIELNGTIALVRYGGSFRGLKVRAAETFGCVGALIYSDPIDDGPLNKEGFPYTNPAKAYPEGPWRSKSSAQRGSVQYLSLLSGDPLTPGYAATEDAVRLDPEDSPGLTKIPSLPLSYEDALPILKATQGHGVRGDKDWSGGLEGVGYFSGPTEGEAILTNHIENKITPIWNVITRIEGTEESDKAIVLGNHRDAWVRRIIV
jgi:N-acetylated-alpha-linked acidic dipeptidase